MGSAAREGKTSPTIFSGSIGSTTLLWTLAPVEVPPHCSTHSPRLLRTFRCERQRHSVRLPRCLGGEVLFQNKRRVNCAIKRLHLRFPVPTLTISTSNAPTCRRGERSICTSVAFSRDCLNEGTRERRGTPARLVIRRTTGLLPFGRRKV